MKSLTYYMFTEGLEINVVEYTLTPFNIQTVLAINNYLILFFLDLY